MKTVSLDCIECFEHIEIYCGTAYVHSVDGKKYRIDTNFNEQELLDYLKSRYKLYFCALKSTSVSHVYTIRDLNSNPKQWASFKANCQKNQF